MRDSAWLFRRLLLAPLRPRCLFSSGWFQTLLEPRSVCGFAHVDTKLQNFLLTENFLVEVSAFLVIAFYVHRNRGTLRLSALLYKIAAESTVYFLAMVAAQIYIQLSFNFTKVYLLQFPPRSLMIIQNCRDHRFQFCEYAVDADRDSLVLRY